VLLQAKQFHFSDCRYNMSMRINYIPVTNSAKFICKYRSSSVSHPFLVTFTILNAGKPDLRNS